MNRERLLDTFLMVVVPAALAVIEMFHPHLHEPMALDTQTWLFVHYAQLLLFPLVALGLVRGLRERRGLFASAARIWAFLFAIGWTAFDTAAGIVTGLLAQAAQQAGSMAQWQAAFDLIWSHPVVGGSPHAAPPLLAVLGSVAIAGAGISAGLAHWRARESKWACLLLAFSGFGVCVFQTHAWPGGPLTFGVIALAQLGILIGRVRGVRAEDS